LRHERCVAWHGGAALNRQALIAGGGIGGLAAALACAGAGWEVCVFERAAQFGEVGAGIQMGPNVMRVLDAWGLSAALGSTCAFPDALQVRDALSGQALASLPLGNAARQRYGAPYATVHRADLHAILLQAAQAREEVHLHLDQPLQSFSQTAQEVTVQRTSGPAVEGDILVGADGLGSAVRQGMLGDGPAAPTGHVAYRCLLQQSHLPAGLRSMQITAWLGPRLHVVQYPVRAGEQLNVVVIVQGQRAATADQWDHAAHASELDAVLSDACTPLRDLLAAADAAHGWRLWILSDRPPLRSAQSLASGRVALLGDAAHPMRPYLAQGAGMAIEDAAELGRVLAMDALDVPTMLRRYALNRWQRNARVQARARRNGQIFHARGPVRLGRNLALRVLGARLLDLPWLYRGAWQA
jgi:salicylate hydroxylase